MNLQAIKAVFKFTFNEKGWPIGYAKRGEIPNVSSQPGSFWVSLAAMVWHLANGRVL